MQAGGPGHRYPHDRTPRVLPAAMSVDVGLALHHRHRHQPIAQMVGEQLLSMRARTDGRWFAAQRVMDASSAWKHTPTGELIVNASKSRLDSPGATGV